MTAPPRLTTALADRYRIEREIGRGGMATVYLALDLRHDRKVALKVLRPELAAVIGAERFLAEIKTTASLQHPHILPLHDSGEADGTVFYVMPFVEGESLRDRLTRDHQLPVDDALRVAREVASALAYAHRHGVVHRDIKPENILLHEGQALVADFGIALAVSRGEGATRMTETGMSLGTPHYMAPEQAMGEREITPKADLYALGCVLYEMLTGDPPFTGSTAQAVVARTLTERPRAIVAQRHTVPPHVEAAVLTALEKLPADRFASVDAFTAALDNPALTRNATAASMAMAPPDWRSRAAIPAIMVAAVMLVAIAWMRVRGAPEGPIARYVLELPAGHDDHAATGVAVSRDGSKLLYVGPADSGRRQLWLKARDAETAKPVSGTTNVQSFTFSPDGQSIAFIPATSQVKKIPITGGAAITLADSAAPARGVAWLDDGTIVYATNVGTISVRTIPAAGGKPTIVYTSDSAGGWYPAALPGSRGVLLHLCGGGTNCPTRSDLVVLDLRSHAMTPIAAGAVGGKYVATGHVLFVRADGGMLAVPFDARSLKVRGAAITVRDSIALGANQLPLYDVSADGTFFMRAGANLAPTATYDLVWIDRTGRETSLDTTFTFRMVEYGSNTGWAISPDGTRLAIGRHTEAGDHVWVKQLPAGALSRVSVDSTQNFRPRWSHDGKRIMYIARRNNFAMLAARAADGTGAESIVASLAPKSVYEAALTLDESTLILRTGGTINQVGGRDIEARSLKGDTTLKPLVATKFDESDIALSPDGRWLAYESNETGRPEVFIRPYPNVDAGKWQVSLDGGRSPLWARNGRELYFVNGQRELAAVKVGAGASPNASAPERLFKLRPDIYLAQAENYTPFDVAPDGRFIMARRIRTTEAKIPPLVVTENWFEELRARLSAR